MSDLAQTQTSLGRLASLLRVYGFTKIQNGVVLKLNYSLTRDSVLCWSWATHLVRVLLWKPSLASSSLALTCGPHSCWSSILRRHRWSSLTLQVFLRDAKVISPLLSWPNSRRDVSFIVIQAKLIRRILSNVLDPSLTNGTIIEMIEYSFWLLEL